MVIIQQPGVKVVTFFYLTFLHQPGVLLHQSGVLLHQAIVLWPYYARLLYYDHITPGWCNMIIIQQSSVNQPGVKQLKKSVV